jgi:hypothetical protein
VLLISTLLELCLLVVSGYNLRQPSFILLVRGYPLDMDLFFFRVFILLPLAQLYIHAYAVSYIYRVVYPDTCEVVPFLPVCWAGWAL